MKKKILTTLAITMTVTAISFLNSCREESISNVQDSQIVKITDANVKNGRLYFPNKEALQITYKELKNRNENEVLAYLENKDLHSLRPIITDSNEKQVIEEIKTRKKELLKSKSNSFGKITDGVGATTEDVIDDLDDMEEIVGDDVYSAMLNGEAEIQIGNSIYKYTDVGLFITPALQYSKLENYLQVWNISENLLQPTEEGVRHQFLSDKTQGQVVTIAEDIDYFIVNRIAPIDPDPEEGGGGGGGPINPPYNPPVEPSIDQVVQNLTVGEIRAPCLGNIFGTSWVVDDKYESNRRVKVKFYSQNLFLVYAVGSKVKHQYKGWTGTWRKENADKLGIGVNSISWTFSHSITYAQGIPGQKYFFENKMFTNVDQYYNYANMGPAQMPRLPFENKIDGVVEWVVNASSLSQEQLRRLFYDFAWKQAKKIGENHNKKYNRVAFIVDTFNSTYIQYYDFSQIEDNQDCIERIFDWGAATPQITYTFGGGVGNGTTISSYQFDFLQPTATAINMYGIAKKNGAWHGVKLIKN